jgi:hypothetical protein
MPFSSYTQNRPYLVSISPVLYTYIFDGELVAWEQFLMSSKQSHYQFLIIDLDLPLQLLRGSVERSSCANLQLGLRKEDARGIARRQSCYMAFQAIISRPARSDKENVCGQGVIDRQGRLRREKGWPKDGISICVFHCPKDATWDGEKLFSFLKSPQRSDAAPSIREVGKLQVIQAPDCFSQLSIGPDERVCV